MKLSESINRDVKLINANAVHALGLKRGFTKTDVKKAYRVAALKYHPDKNKDCDTSCIFAAIQSGYEKLNATLDAGEVPAASGDPQPKRSSANNGGGSSDASHNAGGGTNYLPKSQGRGRRNGPQTSNKDNPPLHLRPDPPSAQGEWPTSGWGRTETRQGRKRQPPRVSSQCNGATPSETRQRESKEHHRRPSQAPAKAVRFQ